MEFDEIVVKESPGLCRCCLSEGCYKDLGTEYTWMDDTEIYADMLLECFDISISQHNEGPNGPNRLICEVCITRLRDACNFKKQVLASEKKFVDMIGRGAFKPKVLVYQSLVKAETNMEIQQQLEEPDVEYLEADLEYEGDDLPKEDETIEQVTEDITVTTLPVKGKRGRPRKNAVVVKSDKKAKVTKSDEKPKTSKAVSKEQNHEAIAEETVMRRRRILAILFNNTTIIPFKWCGNYICFYCGLKFVQYKELYEHTKSHRPYDIQDVSLKCDPTKSFKEHLQYFGEPKFDLSNLICELCERSFDDLSAVIDHLIEEHKFDIDKEVDISAGGYNLKDLKCALCDKKLDCIEDLISHVYIKHSQRSSPVKDFRQSETWETPAKQTRLNTKYSKELPSKFPESRQLNEGDNRRRYTGKHDKSSKSLGISRRQMIKMNRKNLACIIKMSTAIPFKYYQNRFTCFYCSKTFLEHEEMREHTISVHSFAEIEGSLSEILKKFTSRATVDISSLSCRVCNENLEDLEKLIDHLIVAHHVKCDRSVTGVIQAFKLVKYEMKCPSCPNKFSYFNTLLKHINEEHKTKSHLCSTCGVRFGSEAVLTSHVTRTHSKTAFQCTECNASFKVLIKLKSHKAKAHGSKEFPCSMCDEKFLTDYGKHKHLLTMHGVGHRCTHCDRMFIKDSFMRNHVRRIHLVEREIECTVCKKKFFDKEQLKFHMVKHIGSRDFHCDVCGKSFFWKKNLRVHINSHNKHTPVSVKSI